MKPTGVRDKKALIATCAMAQEAISSLELTLEGGSLVVPRDFLKRQARLAWLLSSELLVKMAELELLKSLREGSA